MALVRTKSGIPALDNAFGGFYLKRATLVSGRRKSGKFTVALQFLAKELQSGESAVLFTAKTPREITTALDERGVDSRQAIEIGQLLLCPYSSMKRDGTGPFAPLPFPQAAEELAKLVLENSISCAIFDSVVPWTAMEPFDKMQDHVEDFVSSIDSLKLTSLLLLPNAASPAAQSLTNVLRELCPINIEMESKRFGAEFVLRVTKYQGMTDIELPWEKALAIIPGGGFVAPDDGKTQLANEQAAMRMDPAGQPTKARTPRFRPLIQQGPADFAGGAAAFAPAQQTPQTPQPFIPQAPQPQSSPQTPPQQQRRARFKPLVAPSAEVFAATAPAAASAAEAHEEAPAHAEGPKPSFASVIDVSGFSKGARKASPPAPAPGRREAPVRVPVPVMGAQGAPSRPAFSFDVPSPAPPEQPAQGDRGERQAESSRPKASFSKIIG